ncbi:hypothetical protein [Lysinibacillus xylanilyticus]
MAVEFMEIVNMKKGTFYRKVKEFEESLGDGYQVNKNITNPNRK